MIWLRVDKFCLCTPQDLFWTVLRDLCFHFLATKHQTLISGSNLTRLISLCFLWQKHDSQSSFVFDKIARAFFVFQHRKRFDLDRTPKRTGLSVARVFLFCHQICRAHATLHRCAHKTFHVSSSRVLYIIFYRALATTTTLLKYQNMYCVMLIYAREQLRPPGLSWTKYFSSKIQKN